MREYILKKFNELDMQVHVQRESVNVNLFGECTRKQQTIAKELKKCDDDRRDRLQALQATCEAKQRELNEEIKRIQTVPGYTMYHCIYQHTRTYISCFQLQVKSTDLEVKSSNLER